MKLLLNYLFYTTLALLHVLVVKYSFCFFASLENMKDWYPNVGLVIFCLKFLFLTFLYILTIWLIYRLIKKNSLCLFSYTTRFPFIFVAIILITFMVKENYPFSFYPMYNHFPNYAYTFFFEDENGYSLDKELNDNHGNISHIYFAEFDSKGWRVGNAKETKHHLQIVGESIIKKSFSLEELKKKGVKKINLKRINNHFENNVLKIDTLLISTYGIK